MLLSELGKPAEPVIVGKDFTKNAQSQKRGSVGGSEVFVLLFEELLGRKPQKEIQNLVPQKKSLWKIRIFGMHLPFLL